MGKLDANAFLLRHGPDALRQVLENSAAWPTVIAPGGDERLVEDEPPALPIAPWKAKGETEIPPRKWVFGRHYIRGYASLTVAPGGSGKSALVIAEALSIATGRSLLHRRRAKGRKYGCGTWRTL